LSSTEIVVNFEDLNNAGLHNRARAGACEVGGRKRNRAAAFWDHSRDGVQDRALTGAVASKENDKLTRQKRTSPESAWW